MGNVSGIAMTEEKNPSRRLRRNPPGREGDAVGGFEGNLFESETYACRASLKLRSRMVDRLGEASGKAHDP